MKCLARNTPCGQCHRLGLSCESSFDQNFKSWSTSDTSSPRWKRERKSAIPGSPTPGAHAPAEDGQSQDPETHTHRLSQIASESSLALDETDTSRIEPVEGELSFNLLDYIFSDLVTEMAPGDLTSAMNFEWAASNRPQDPGTPLAGAAVEGSLDASTRTFQDQQLAPVERSLDGAVDPAISRVPGWLSTKQSIWTCFHYLVNSAQKIPDSPLCHAILGWAYAYLCLLGAANTSELRNQHYTAASRAIQAIADELVEGHNLNAGQRWHCETIADQLSLYISCTFFLCQHDLMVGYFDAFMSRNASTKAIFRRCWSRKITPGPIESRIVIWLAFVELRFFYLCGHIAGDLEEKDLMTVLAESKAIRVLRPVRTSLSALGECFGRDLPPEENEEDLKKDRCRVKFDDLMLYLAKLRRFEAWTESMKPRIEAGDLMLRELNDAKVDALEAELLRLQAVCHQAFKIRGLQTNANMDRSASSLSPQRPPK